MEFDQFEVSPIEIDRISWMFDSLRCHGVSECLFSVVLYAPIKLHAQRVATNVIGTLATGKKYKKRGKREETEREKERENCPGEKIRRFALSIRLFHKSESDLPSSFSSHSILNIPFGSVNRDIFIAAIRHSGNILLCMYWLKFPLGSLCARRNEREPVVWLIFNIVIPMRRTHSRNSFFVTQRFNRSRESRPMKKKSEKFVCSLPDFSPSPFAFVGTKVVRRFVRTMS